MELEKLIYKSNEIELLIKKNSVPLEKIFIRFYN